METFGVATKAVIFNQGKVLILYKSETEDINPNSFDLPGGRLQFGEKPEEALKREVQEEVGLSVTPNVISEVWTFTKQDFQLVGITYLCLINDQEIKLSGEHTKFRWVTPDELMDSSEYPEWLKESVQKASKLL